MVISHSDQPQVLSLAAILLNLHRDIYVIGGHLVHVFTKITYSWATHVEAPGRIQPFGKENYWFWYLASELKSVIDAITLPKQKHVHFAQQQARQGVS